MTIRWERLEGDTSVFALRMAFAPDPDGGRYIDPDVGLSWGSFQIWVEDRNLCTHLEEGERVESVHWYLLPLLEWFTRQWNPLLHEERFPIRTEDDIGWTSLHATRFPPRAIEDDDRRASEWESAWQDWWMRHALRAAREGGLFPDVVIRSFRGDSVEVSWGPIRSEGAMYRFDATESTGFSRLPRRAVAEPLHATLSRASEHLVSLGHESRRIEALSRNVRALGRSTRQHEDRGRRLVRLSEREADERTPRTGRWRSRNGYER